MSIIHLLFIALILVIFLPLVHVAFAYSGWVALVLAIIIFILYVRGV